MSFACSGSAPKTRISGLTPFAAIEVPANRPPPPTQTTIASRSGTSSKQFKRRRALTRDDPFMIERRDEDRSGLFRKPPRHGFTIILQTIVEDDLRAIVLRRFQLCRRSICRHCDLRAHAEFTSGDRDRLGMIARREGDYAARTFTRRNRKQEVCRATNLERPAALEVFTFEEALQPSRRIERAAMSERACDGSAARFLSRLYECRRSSRPQYPAFLSTTFCKGSPLAKRWKFSTKKPAASFSQPSVWSAQCGDRSTFFIVQNG